MFPLFACSSKNPEEAELEDTLNQVVRPFYDCTLTFMNWRHVNNKIEKSNKGQKHGVCFNLIWEECVLTSDFHVSVLFVS